MVDNLKKAAKQNPDAEFIMQRNDETELLWAPMLEAALPNVSFLFDASKGRGIVAEEYPPPPPEGIKFGYTGGLKPCNIAIQMDKMEAAAQGREIWLDMESSLRTKLQDGQDVFDVNKAMACIKSVVGAGFKSEAGNTAA